VSDMVVVADAGMLSAVNLNSLQDAGFSFIVGSRITKALRPGRALQRHGDYFTDGQILESSRVMDRRAARTRRIVYQTPRPGDTTAGPRTPHSAGARR
jgi:hypothetical protein